jgi:hypothetical protein
MSNQITKLTNWQSKLGIVLSGLISVPFLMSAMMKFKGASEVLEGWNHSGWPQESLMMIGMIELLSVVIYLIPKTAILGAILLTGYLGGAIATHLRMSEGVFLQVVFGVVIWVALYLRDTRLREILPLRK